jgi:extracellular matrix regulatory protein A
MRFINIGFGNAVSSQRVIAVIASDSAPVKRMIQESREAGRLIDGTAGRKTRTVIQMDSGHVVLSALQPETIIGRLKTEKDEGGVQ